MRGIDSLLDLVVQQRSDELRMGSDAVPLMLRAGVPQTLSLPATNDTTLRRLLGDLLGAEREALLARGETLRFAHAAPDGTPFRVVLRFRPGGGQSLEVAFARGSASVGDERPDPGTRSRAEHHGSAPSNRSARRDVRAAEVSHADGLRAESASHAGSALPKGPDAAAEDDGMATLGETTAAPPSLSGGASEEQSLPSRELKALLVQAVERGASDVHLCDRAPPTLRIDGALTAVAGAPPVAMASLLEGLLSASDLQSVLEGHACDSTATVPDIGCFRLNVYRAEGAIAAAIRILPRHPPSLESLALPLPIDDVVDLPHGLVLVCGPTGSGKSTTLAALADRAVKRRPHLLITLEDPIEYRIGADGARGLVRQRQVGRDVRDFPSGLRDALREDPDILLIGEMRDSESISLALTAAETGHLVLASLHSRSASSAIERIADTYPPERQRQIRGQLADSLRVVISQRLLGRANGPGRVVALEVLRVNHGVASAIRENNSGAIVSTMQSARREGMIPLERALADLVRRGDITRKTAYAATNDASVLEQYLAR